LQARERPAERERENAKGVKRGVKEEEEEGRRRRRSKRPSGAIGDSEER